ncbi:HicB protein [hydrothermal vent metagenome]|uniref:HicB protein n=1 Tax=hydrothermal vent metagenome TaxID=652676 RepID=A0A1W1E3Z5_9ZZZZ
MKYKGYEAVVKFDEDDDCFVGQVINITPPTAIAFDAQSVAGLKTEFHTMIDFYLETCNKENIKPKQPMNGKMTIRMSPATHAGVLAQAHTQGMSANKFINQAIEQRLQP